MEIGIPFSDAMVDRKTTQHSSEIAIGNGGSNGAILNSIGEFWRSSQLPIILMGYINPILGLRCDNFLSAYKIVGVDGVIVPDLFRKDRLTSLLSVRVAAPASSSLSHLRAVKPASAKLTSSQPTSRIVSLSPR